MATIQRRITADRRITYRVRVRLKPHPVQSATFVRLTDARRWAIQVEAAIREGRYFRTTESQRHTLAEAIDRYIVDVLPVKPRNRDRRNHAARLKWWKGRIGHYPLASVTPALIAQYRDKLSRDVTARGKRRSPATVNRYLANLSHVFTIMIREWGWMERSPMPNVGRRQEPRGRTRFLSDSERDQLLRACSESPSPYLFTVVTLALSTGMRYSEIMTLTWDNVDLDRGMIQLWDTKNNEPRSVPLAGQALNLVKDLSKGRSHCTKLLFPRLKNPAKPAHIRDAWEKTLERAGIKDFRFHDLRHSAASYLAMNGATPSEIAAILGHKTLQMVKRYAHLSEQHTAGVVTRMNEKVFGGG